MEVQLKNGMVLQKRLGKGSFGEVYLATGEDGIEYAAKLEMRRTKDGKRRRGPSQLDYEFRVYEMLKGCKGIPKIVKFFSDGDYNVLIMEKLGKSIQDVFEERGPLPAKIVLALGARVLKHLQYIHGMGLIHRDLKPQNIMLGSEPSSREVYIIDFGLSKRVILEDGSHISYCENKGGLTGTPRYASVSSHMCIEQSRRDDLESLLYIMAFLRSGRLPWQGTRGERKERYKKILKKKRMISDVELSDGWPAPFFHDFVSTIRSLRFSEKPDYKHLLKLLLQAHDSIP